MNGCSSNSGDGITQVENGKRECLQLKSTLHGFITKHVIKSGNEYDRPALDSTCKLDIELHKSTTDEAKSNVANLNKAMTGQNIELQVGCCDSEFMRRVETCVITMTEGEESLFTLSLPHEVFGTVCNEDKGIAEENPEVNNGIHSLKELKICLQLTLHSFTKTCPLWKQTSAEKFNLAISHKTKGTQLFQAGDISAAFHRYSTAVMCLTCISEISAVSPIESKFLELSNSAIEEYKNLKHLCHLNLAACQAKHANHQGVVDNCTQALVYDASSVKALYRRAVAYLALQKKDEARYDLIKAAKIDPRSKSVVTLLQSCH